MNNKNLPKIQEQVKKLSINLVAALGIPVVIIALAVMAGAMIWQPETFYTHSRQVAIYVWVGAAVAAVYVPGGEE